MAAYVEALTRFRKQLSQPKETVEDSSPSPAGGGLLQSRSRINAQAETAAAAQVQYRPSAFVVSGLEQIRSQRGQTLKRMREAAASMKETMAEASAKTVAATKVVDTTEIEEENSAALMGRRPFRGLTDGPKGKEMAALPQQSGNSDVREDADFMSGVQRLADKYNVPLSHMMSLMHFETGGTFDPGQRNAVGSGATGLIQFMPSTAKGLGTTTEALSKLSRKDQLAWVEKYFDQSGIAKAEQPSASDLYMAVLWPKAVGKPSDYVLWKEGSKQYEQNKGLDRHGKGYVTKADAAAKAMQYIDFYGGE